MFKRTRTIIELHDLYLNVCDSNGQVLFTSQQFSSRAHASRAAHKAVERIPGAKLKDTRVIDPARSTP
jgi:uncharacterized protein YegP (UPF0339 family)